MKITVELSDAQVRGIKRYLNEGEDPNDKAAITRFINSIVQGTLDNERESVSDYIREEEAKEK